MEKTITNTRFLFANNGFEYTKIFENALKDFVNEQVDEVKEAFHLKRG